MLCAVATTFRGRLAAFTDEGVEVDGGGSGGGVVDGDGKKKGRMGAIRETAPYIMTNYPDLTCVFFPRFIRSWSHSPLRGGFITAYVPLLASLATLSGLRMAPPGLDRWGVCACAARAGSGHG